MLKETYQVIFFWGLIVLLLSLIALQAIQIWRSKKKNDNQAGSIHIPSRKETPIISQDEAKLQTELESLKQKTRKADNRFKVLIEPEEEPPVRRPEPVQPRKKVPDFVPLDETQVRPTDIPRPQLHIPDNIFKQNTQPQRGVLSIPFKIAEIDGVFGCLIFDMSGLVISSTPRTQDFDKNRLAAYSLEILRTFKKAGIKDNSVTWLSAWIGNQSVVIIEKEGMGCTLTLSRNVDIMQIANIAMSIIGQLSRYRPEEYR